jgi:heme a synthase
LVKQQHIANLAWIAAVLAFFVVGLGAYTRLTDSGLGCPDWPGCYGQLTVPEQTHDIARAQAAFPGQTVEPAKAWNEMFHRYVAGSLGTVMLVLAALLWLLHRRSLLPWMLIGLLFFQAALGMWTVTWQLLPLVVMGHLLGGLLILSLLWWTRLTYGKPLLNLAPPPASWQRYKPWMLAAIVIVFLQIALGGWTSSNYAALACPDFPWCNGRWLPVLNLHDAFNLLAPIGHNYEGGHLDSVGRVTIQFMHRVGALVVVLYVGGLSLFLFFRQQAPRMLLGLVLLLLTVQIILGIINAMHLPLVVAVGHNLVAALLLLTLLSLNHWLFAKFTAPVVAHE